MIRIPSIFKASNSAILDREKIADFYLRGNGIEIGALYLPLKAPTEARVTYVDRMTVAQLREHYPEYPNKDYVTPDVIDDGETLSSFKSETQDFVIANHFIEHCQNPIGTIENFLRVLKTGGVLYLAIPDKRYTFDLDREPTPLDHLIRDYKEGPAWSRRQHFEDWVRLVQKVEDETEAQKRIAHYLEIDYSIHYHVWTQVELFELITFLRRDLPFPFELQLFFAQKDECILILKKTA